MKHNRLFVCSLGATFSEWEFLTCQQQLHRMSYFQRAPWLHTADPRGSHSSHQYFASPAQTIKSFLFCWLTWTTKEEIFPCKHLKTALDCKHWAINKKYTQNSCAEDSTHPKRVLLRFVGHSDWWGGTHFIVTNWNQNNEEDSAWLWWSS